jgi:hypothetical protein
MPRFVGVPCTRQQGTESDCETYFPIGTPPIKLGGLVAHALAFLPIYPSKLSLGLTEL